MKPLQDKYNDFLLKESAANKVTTKIKKSEWIPSIDYIWVTFKDNRDSPDLAKFNTHTKHPMVYLVMKVLGMKVPDA